MSTNQSPFQSGVEYDFGQPRSFESFVFDTSGTSLGPSQDTGVKQFAYGRFVGQAHDGRYTFEGMPTNERAMFYFSVPQGTPANRR